MYRTKAPGSSSAGRQITLEELAVELVDAIDPSVGTSAEWMRAAEAYAVEQGFEVVGDDGTEYGLAEVLRAIAPTDEDLKQILRDDARHRDELEGKTIKASIDDPEFFEIVKAVEKRLDRERRTERPADPMLKSLRMERRDIPTPNPNPKGNPTMTTTTTHPTKRAAFNAERRQIITGGTPRNDDERAHGFNHLGEFAKSIIDAGHPDIDARRVDDRLLKSMSTKAPTAFGTGSTGSEGGFAIPQQFVNEVMRNIDGEDSILSMTDQLPLTGRTLDVPYDDIAPWDNSSGIRSYWDGDEGSQHTSSKPKIKLRSYKLSGITALVPITEDLAEDAAALNAWLPPKAGEKLDFQVSEAIFRGTGAGQPLGFLNSDALIAPTRNDASGINAADVTAVYSRLYSRYRRDAVFFYHPSVEPDLLKLNLEGSGGAIHPVYLPAGGYSQTPFATIFGRPALPTEHCAERGNKGDFVAASMSRYQATVKSSGLQVAESMHLYFDYSIKAFRFRMRVDGAPKLSAPIQPRTGDHTLSAFVTPEDAA